MQKSKAGSLRLVSYLELGIDHAYCLEGSLAGSGGVHFTVESLCAFGGDICRRYVTEGCRECCVCRIL